MITDEFVGKPPETTEEAYSRFWGRYTAMCSQPDQNWFDRHVTALLSIAVPELRQPVVSRRPGPNQVWNSDKFIEFYSTLAS